MSLVEAAELARRLRGAFPDADPPPEAEAFQYGRDDWELQRAHDIFGDKRWASLCASDLVVDPDAYTYLSDAGFRYYLPSYLLAVLTEGPEKEAEALYEPFVRVFVPPGRSGGQAARLWRATQALTPEQLCVLADVYVWTTAKFGAIGAPELFRARVKRYWAKVSAGCQTKPTLGAARDETARPESTDRPRQVVRTSEVQPRKARDARELLESIKKQFPVPPVVHDGRAEEYRKSHPVGDHHPGADLEDCVMRFSGRPWDSLAAEEISEYWDCIAFLEPSHQVYMLPALLSAAIQLERDALVHLPLAWLLGPLDDDGDPTWPKPTRSPLIDVLTPGQREVVRAFMEWWIAERERDSVYEEILPFWS
jgi:hypothetical protein